MTRANAVTASGRPRRLNEPMPSAATSEKTPSPSERIESDEIGPGGARERPVGYGVRGEGRTAQHHEEADDPGDDGDDRPRLPRVHHEAAEHQCSTLTRYAARSERRAHAPDAASHHREPRDQIGHEYQPDDEEADRETLARGQPVEAVVGEEDAQADRDDADETGQAIALRTEVVRRTAAAAGPMSNAVERIEPTAMAESPTETAMVT